MPGRSSPHARYRPSAGPPHAGHGSGDAGPARRAASLVCGAFAAITLALVPAASRPMVPMPGFIPTYQATLIAVYAVTTYLFFAQYRRTRSVPLFVLGAGSLYTTLVVFVQLLSFPNIFGAGRVIGTGPDTTTWLWTLWQVGPSLFTLPYAIMEGDGRRRNVDPARVRSTGRVAVLATALAVGVLTVIVTR